jgi:hypothetical protein
MAPPTAQDVRKMVSRIHQSVTFEVYWAGRDWLFTQYAGIFYEIPPDLDGRMIAHPYRRNSSDMTPLMVRADGRLEIRDRIGSDGEVTKDGSAQDIAAFLVEKHFRHGLALLGQGPEKDARAIAYAKQQAKEAKRLACEADTDAWKAHIKKWLESPANKGKPLPVPPQRIADAQDYLDDLATEVVEEFKYTCQVCGSIRTNDFERYARHMKASHGEDVAPPEATSAAPPEASGGPAEVPVKKRRGRPPKNKAEAPQVPPAT